MIHHKSMSLDIDHESSQLHPVKVYTDATVQNGVAGIGFVVTDHQERPLDAAHRPIGKGFGIAQAEYVALRDALEMLSYHTGIQHVKCYTDCDTVLDGAWATVEDNDVWSSFDYLTLDTIDREANWLADLVAGVSINAPDAQMDTPKDHLDGGNLSDGA